MRKDVYTYNTSFLCVIDSFNKNYIIEFRKIILDGGIQLKLINQTTSSGLKNNLLNAVRHIKYCKKWCTLSYTCLESQPLLRLLIVSANIGVVMFIIVASQYFSELSISFLSLFLVTFSTITVIYYDIRDLLPYIYTVLFAQIYAKRLFRVFINQFEPDIDWGDAVSVSEGCHRFVTYVSMHGFDFYDAQESHYLFLSLLAYRKLYQKHILEYRLLDNELVDIVVKENAEEQGEDHCSKVLIAAQILRDTDEQTTLSLTDTGYVLSMQRK